MDKSQLSNLLHIQDASFQGRLVVFVGAGVSNNSGVPTWSKLIQEMKNSCGADLETDDLKIAQLYKDARGEKEYMDKIKEVLQYNKVFPNEIHKAILDLTPCHIITTNYDNLIEQEIENEFKQFAIIREDKDLPNVSYPNCLIKMHGDFETNNIVLTESDYYNYERNYSLIRSFVLSLFASKLVVFVGFSFADLNLKMILNDLHTVLHDSMQRVYLVSDTQPSHIMNSYYESKGINVVYLEESDIKDILGDEKRSNLSDPKGAYLFDVLNCIRRVRKESTRDLSSLLYSRLKECKDELPTIGDGIKYFIPAKERPIFNPYSEGLELRSPYFISLNEQLKTFGGKKKFLLDHPEIDRKELKEIAFDNYLFKIDGIDIVDRQKQIDQFVKSGDFSALWHFYRFDFNNLHKRILYLSSRDLTGDFNDLEYPYVLYKIGNYYEAYQVYNRLLPIAWKRKKYILYFICLFNIRSIRNGVYVSLMFKNEELANSINSKLSNIDLEEILGRLPLPERIRKTFQDLLSFRFLGNTAVETEDRREQLFKQRKSGEQGGFSINSNIVSLLTKFERTFQFSNNNYIICDNNDFYDSIAYNTACGILNSYATPESKKWSHGIRTTKIEQLSSFCLFCLIFHVEYIKLKEIFSRYEIDKIEITDEAVVSINEYWANLAVSSFSSIVDWNEMGDYIENLVYVTSNVKTEGIKPDNVYTAVLKYWDYISSFKVNGYLLSMLLSNIKPNKEILFSILDRLVSNLDTYDGFTSCYEKIAFYLSEMHVTYDLDMTKLKQGKYSNELYHLYRVINPSIQNEFSSYCQTYLNQAWDYLTFVADNQLDIISIETFKKKIESLNGNPDYYKSYCFWKLCKMRTNEQYINLYSIIDACANENDCLKFYLAPLDYCNKEQINAEWIIYNTDSSFLVEMARVPEYGAQLKQYLMDNKYLPLHVRNRIIAVL